MRQNADGKRHTTQQSLNGAVKSICDIMRRSNCAGALQYVPELTWILFLRILDEREAREARRGRGARRRRSRRRSTSPIAGGTGRRRRARSEWRSGKNGTLGSFFGFVNSDLMPHLKGLREQAERDAAPEGHQRDHVRRRAHADRHREELPRRARQGRTRSAPRRSTPRTSSRSRRSTRACCSRWARRATTAASSSRRARSSARWCESSIRRSARRCTIPGAARAAFWRRASSTWRGRATRRSPRPRSSRR